jgi:hypothetical protein
MTDGPGQKQAGNYCHGADCAQDSEDLQGAYPKLTGVLYGRLDELGWNEQRRPSNSNDKKGSTCLVIWGFITDYFLSITYI